MVHILGHHPKASCPTADRILKRALILTIHQRRPISTPLLVALRSLRRTSLLLRIHGLSVPSLQDLCSGDPIQGRAMPPLPRTRLIRRPTWDISNLAILRRRIQPNMEHKHIAPATEWPMEVDMLTGTARRRL